MKLSILVATLGAIQINGAVGSKEAREQLRRNLRQNGRRAQCKSFGYRETSYLNRNESENNRLTQLFVCFE